MKKLMISFVLFTLFFMVSFAVSDSVLFGEAKVLWDKNKYEDCLNVCGEFLESFAVSEFTDDILFLRGKCYYYLWDMENALKKEEHEFNLSDAVFSFSRLIDDFPDSDLCPDSLMWIGNCYYFNGEFDNSINSYKRLTEDYPENPECKNAYYRIGKCYEGKNDLESALSSYKKVTELFPGTSAAKQAEFDIKRIEKLLEN